MIEVIGPESICQNHRDCPGCLGTVDPEFTESFEDIGEGCLYFCSFCGPEAKKMIKMLEDFVEKDPKNSALLKNIIEETEKLVNAEKN